LKCAISPAVPNHQGIFRKVVGHVRAVDGVSFTIPKGKTSVWWANLAAQDNTSRMILRAFDPTSGQVMFDDRNLGWLTLRSSATRRCAGFARTCR